MKFISKELAIKLKEKGFDKPCFGWYDTQIIENNMLYLNITKGNGDYKDLLEYTNDFEWIIDAPTIEQVLEWLREEKKIYVGITYMPKIGNNTDFYYPTIQKIGDFEPTHFGDNDEIFNSYDDAAIAGIEYVINNLI